MVVVGCRFLPAGAHSIRFRRSPSTIDIGDQQFLVRRPIGVSDLPDDARNRQQPIAFADSSVYVVKGRTVDTSVRPTAGTRWLGQSVHGALSGLTGSLEAHGPRADRLA